MLEQCVRVDKIWLQNASVLQANVRVTTTHDNSSNKEGYGLYQKLWMEEPSIWRLNLDYSTTPLNIYSAFIVTKI